MQGLMLDTPGSHLVTAEQLAALEPPKATASYTPVPYHELVDLVRTTAKERTGLAVRDEQFGISRMGKRFFGVLTLDTGAGDRGLAIGVRSSDDMSMSVAIATGGKVFVCSNLCFSGDAVVVMRRHSKHVWDTLRSTVDDAIGRASMNYEAMDRHIRLMGEKPMTLDDGYSLLGRMAGHKILSSRQLTVATGDWRTPRHAEFEDRNAWSLYNCVTESLKKGDQGSMIGAHTRAHDFVVSDLDLSSPPKVHALV